MAELTTAERTLYVRQTVLAEIGAAGQRRLLDARFSAPPSRAGAIAGCYLERAGLKPSLGDDALGVEPSHGEASLAAIEDALRGSFEAVEVIKRALHLGRPGQLSANLLAPASSRTEAP